MGPARAIDKDGFKAWWRYVLTLENEAVRRQPLFRQWSAMDENAEGTVRITAIIVSLFAKEVPQHGFGGGPRLRGQSAGGRAEKAADVEVRAGGKRHRRRQLRKKRTDDETAPQKGRWISTPAQLTPPMMSALA